MPNFENSRQYSSGDGYATTIHDQYKDSTVRVGDTIDLSVNRAPAKAPEIVHPTTGQAVSASYTTRTTDDIINEQFESADAHSKSINKKRETAYMIIETLKFVMVAATSWGGGTFAASWTPEAGIVLPMGVKFASVVLFAIGPWFAYALAYYLKIGVFAGISKKIAWLMIAVVIIEEALALRGMRDPQFAHWLMVELGPYSLAGMLGGLVALGFLRHDLKRKRDLAEMKASEEDMLAKNATESRMVKARREMRQRTVQKMGEFVAHKIKSGFVAVMVVPYAFFLNIGAAHRETVDAVKILNAPAKKSGTTTKKKKTAAPKKSGQGGRK